MAVFAVFLFSLLLAPFVSVALLPSLFRQLGRVVGHSVRSRTQCRRQLILEHSAAEEDRHADGAAAEQNAHDDDWEKVEGYVTGTVGNGATPGKDWKGVVGFFHPFCNAGGGGERVLWAAIRATQQRWPNAVCVVYTGDHDADKNIILRAVETRFNIHIHPPKTVFLYLSTRHFVLASTWPHFTLLGQSLGSLVLAYDAFTLLVPDIFIDTMGYAFTLAFSRFLFPDVPVGAYVHYPTISTDMLSSLDEGSQGVNAGTGVGFKGGIKRRYWHLFAWLYGYVGNSADIVMTNSSWTQSHIRSLWGPRRAKTRPDSEISVVYPPVAVAELEREIEVSAESEKERGPYLLYIAQFRPEKNHELILTAFSQLLRDHYPSSSPSTENNSDPARPKLILIGSVRDGGDERRVYNLRLLARELKITEAVEFICDASWPQVLQWLRRASVGVNGMWNEHFGIGVVEYQAAGLISVVNESGGPKMDIVVSIDSAPTGFHATSAADFAAAFHSALVLDPTDSLAMRKRARKSAKRFTEDAFATKWVEQMARLIELQEQRAPRSTDG